MKRFALVTMALVALAILGGCQPPPDASKTGDPATQAKQDDGTKADAQTDSSTDTPAAADPDNSDTAGKNAITDNEDAASRDRRMKARASLGLK